MRISPLLKRREKPADFHSIQGWEGGEIDVRHAEIRRQSGIQTVAV